MPLQKLNSFAGASFYLIDPAADGGGVFDKKKPRAFVFRICFVRVVVMNSDLFFVSHALDRFAQGLSVKSQKQYIKWRIMDS